MNNVSLIGRFARDPELRYTQTGKAVTMFTLAVRNPFDPDGNADFIPCVAWNGAAELIANDFRKGMMIGVDGRINTRSYEDSEGRMIYVVEVNVNNIHFVTPRENGQADPEPEPPKSNQRSQRKR